MGGRALDRADRPRRPGVRRRVQPGWHAGRVGGVGWHGPGLGAGPRGLGGRFGASRPRGRGDRRGLPSRRDPARLRRGRPKSPDLGPRDRPGTGARSTPGRRNGSTRWPTIQTARGWPSRATTARWRSGTPQRPGASSIIPATRGRCSMSGTAPGAGSWPRPARTPRSRCGTPTRSPACSSSASSRRT